MNENGVRPDRPGTFFRTLNHFFVKTPRKLLTNRQSALSGIAFRSGFCYNRPVRRSVSIIKGKALSPIVNGTLRVALAALIWGAAYPLTKVALADVPPLLLGFFRFLLAGCLFMASEKSLPLQKIASEDRKSFVGLAFWGVFVLIIGMNYGLIWAPGMAASILSGTPPLFTVVLAALILGEKIRKVQFISIALALGGLAMLGSDFSASAKLEPWQIWAGCLMTLVPQFSWAMYGIAGKKLIERYHWRLICRDTFSLGALMLLPPAIIEAWFRGAGSWSWQTVFILLYLAVMNSVVTYSLWNSALKMIPVSLASFLIYLQPVSGAVLSYLLFGEKLTTGGFVGTALIFVALTLVLLPQPVPGKSDATTVAES